LPNYAQQSHATDEDSKTIGYSHQSISIENLSGVDNLKRVKFARHLLDIAMRVDVNCTSGVIGLEGVWGSGKTRVLAAAEAEIEGIEVDNRPILIKFNPWMISGTDNLVEAFLLQMATDIGPQSKGEGSLQKTASVAESLIDYAGLLGMVKNMAPVANLLLPGSGHFLAIIGGVAEMFGKDAEPAKAALARLSKSPEKLSLNAVKKRVGDALKELGCRVIILLDDLDRLPPKEFVCMLQMVKAVADFPNVVFVMAYDPKFAAHAVRRVLDLDEDGLRYLEKIVQVPLVLPEPPASRLNKFARDRLESGIDMNNLPEYSRSDLNRAWPILAALMETPRDIERLRTRLMIAVPMLMMEVNIADVALLEALSLKAPALIQWVRDNPRVVAHVGNESRYDNDLAMRGKVGRTLEAEGTTAIDDSAHTKAQLDDWKTEPLKGLGSPIAAAKAMAFLFDKVQAARILSEKRSDYCRVQHFKFFYQWLCYHDNHDPWSKSELDQFLQNPKSIVDGGLHLNRDSFLNLCQLMWSFGATNFTEADSVSLIESFREVELTIGTDVFFNHSDGLSAIETLMLALSVDFKNRLLALDSLVAKMSEWVSGIVLERLCKETFSYVDQENSTDKPLIAKVSDLQPILEKWFAKADAALSLSSPSEFPIGRAPWKLLVWMKRMGRSISVILQKSDEFLNNDPERLAVCFSDCADRPEYDGFPVSIEWDVFNPEKVKDLAAAAPEFSKKYKKLLEHLENHIADKNKLPDQLDANLARHDSKLTNNNPDLS
jgi:hypothetical protein